MTGDFDRAAWAGRGAVSGGLAALFLAALAARGDPVRDDERIQFADGLASRGMHELAAKEYGDFLLEKPEAPKADAVRFRLAESLRLLGQRARAMEEYGRVVTAHPQSEYRFRSQFRLAEMQMEDGRQDQAVEMFRALLTAKPPDAIASASLYFLGDLLLKQGKTSEGVETLERLRTQHPDSEMRPFAVLKLGETYGKDKNTAEKALELYRTIAERPASERLGAEALFQLAELHFRRQEFARSSELYGKLQASYPADKRSGEGGLQAAWAAHNAGLYAEGLRRVAAAMAQPRPEAEQAEWRYVKANCERQLARLDEAVATYAGLLEKYPRAAVANAARYEMALCYSRMGKPAQAAAEAEKILNVPETRKDVLWLLADSYAGAQRTDDAIQYFRLLVQEFPTNDIAPDATYRLAHLLQGKNQFQEAARYYGAVAGSYPAHKLAPQALFASAVCLSRDGRDAEAVRDWTSLLQKYPSDALAEESQYQKAMAEVRLRRDGDAAVSLHGLLQRYPKTKFLADAHFWQGALFREAGKLPEAAAEFRTALASSPRDDLKRETELQLALTLQKKGDGEEAASLLQPLLATSTRAKIQPGLLEWLAEFRHEKRQFAESAAAAGALTELAPDPAWRQTGWGLLGRAQLGAARVEEARKAFEQALATGARTRFAAESSLRLGEIALGAKDRQTADKYYRQAAEQAADDTQISVRAHAYAGLARVSKEAGDWENARRYFQIVALLFEDDQLAPECLYEAAEALRKLGKTEESRKMKQELGQRYPASPWAKKAGAGSEVLSPAGGREGAGKS